MAGVAGVRYVGLVWLLVASGVYVLASVHAVMLSFRGICM